MPEKAGLISVKEGKIMNKLTTGLVIGSLMGVAGAGYLRMNNSARKKVVRKGKKIMNKAENMIDDMSSADMW